VQAAGRATRISGVERERGYILVPVYLAAAEDESIEEAARRTNFETVLDVLQSLQEVDEVLREDVRELHSLNKFPPTFVEVVVHRNANEHPTLDHARSSCPTNIAYIVRPRKVFSGV
jgi:predicted helicase